jgi:hypothetical protein
VIPDTVCGYAQGDEVCWLVKNHPGEHSFAARAVLEDAARTAEDD